MMTRPGLLTPHDFICLAYFNELMNAPPIVETLPEINTIDLLYSSMLQAGIDRIELPFGFEQEHESVSPFLKKHLVFDSGEEWKKASVTVQEFFDYHIPSFSIANELADKQEDSDENDEKDHVLGLYSFLIKLLCVLSSGRNLINLDSFPDASKLIMKLPPEVSLPVKNLLDTFERVSPSSPCPKITIDRDNVGVFEDIIMSQRFNQCKSAHSSLEDPTISTTTSAKYINQATKVLRTHTRPWLKGRKILISVLPFSARLVDVIFGALPGKLAEQFTRLTQDWLTKNQRLVIYQLDGAKDLLLEGRINAYCVKRAAAYASSKI